MKAGAPPTTTFFLVAQTGDVAALIQGGCPLISTSQELPYKRARSMSPESTHASPFLNFSQVRKVDHHRRRGTSPVRGEVSCLFLQAMVRKTALSSLGMHSHLKVKAKLRADDGPVG